MREFASPHRPPARPRVRSRPRRVWVVVVVVLLAVIALVIASIPFALQYGLERWLLARGASEVTIRALHVQPFRSTIEVDHLSVRNRNDELVRIDELRGHLLWRELWQGQIAFDQVELRQSQVLLDSTVLRFLPTSSDLWWPIHVRGTKLSGIAFKTHDGDVPVRIDQGNVEAWSTDTSAPIRMTLTGSVYNAPLRIQLNGTMNGSTPSGDMQLEVDGLDLRRVATRAPYEGWQGNITANLRLSSRLDSQQRPIISHEGTVRAQSMARETDQVDLQIAEAVWAGNGQLWLDNNVLRIEQQGQLNLKAPRWRTARGHYNADTMEWHGSIRAEAEPDHPIALRSDGIAQADGVMFAPQRDETSFQIHNLHWQGPLSYGAADVPGGWSARGQLQLTDLALGQDQGAAPLLTAARAILHGVDVKGTYAMQAQSLELWNYSAFTIGEAENKAVVTGEQAVFEGLTVVNQNRLQAEQLTLNGTDLLLRKTTSGQWAGLFPRGHKPAQDGTAADSSWRIGRIAFAGDNNHIEFSDGTVQPPFKRQLRVEELTLSDLDTATPNQPSPFALHARSNDGARVVAVGKLLPFSESTELSLKTKVTALPLAPLSPYSIQHLGYGISAGVAQLDSDMHVIDDKLRTKTRLKMHGLQLESNPHSGTQAFRDSLAMPMTLAASLLRDETQQITVTVPIRGDLQSDDFQLGVAFDHALGVAVRSAATSIVVNNLHPFGLAETHDHDGVALEPVRFRTETAELNQVSRTYLRRVGALLRARPAVNMYLCGSADGSEQAEAEQLAQSRGEVVQTALIEEENINSGRLTLCDSPTGRSDGPVTQMVLK